MKIFANIVSILITVLIWGLDYKWYDKRTKRFKNARLALFILILFSLIFSTFSMIQDDWSRQEFEKNTEAKINQLISSNKVLENRLFPFLDLAKTIFPNKQVDDALENLKEEMKSLIKNTENILDSTNKLNLPIKDFKISFELVYSLDDSRLSDYKEKIQKYFENYQIPEAPKELKLKPSEPIEVQHQINSSHPLYPEKHGFFPATILTNLNITVKFYKKPIPLENYEFSNLYLPNEAIQKPDFSINFQGSASNTEILFLQRKKQIVLKANHLTTLSLPHKNNGKILSLFDLLGSQIYFEYSHGLASQNGLVDNSIFSIPRKFEIIFENGVSLRFDKMKTVKNEDGTHTAFLFQLPEKENELLKFISKN